MDAEEWEVVPDDGFLEIHDDGGNKIFSRKYICDNNYNNTVFHNYFICPTSDATQFVDSTTIQFPLRIQKTTATADDDDEEEVTKEVVTSNQVVPFEINMLPSTISAKIKAPPPAMKIETEHYDQIVSQVFFKKLNSQDMKPSKSSNKPQIDAAAPFPCEEVSEFEVIKNSMEAENNIDEEESRGGLKLLRGIGAICSFGVAAAAISIIFIANPHKHTLRFHSFSHHKRMKQMVEQASKN